jgi:hypothetical protein
VNVFNPGGSTVNANSGVTTVTLDGIGDVVKVSPNGSGQQCAVNGVWGAVNESVYVRVPFDAATVEVNGGSSGARVIRGAVS